MRFIVDLFRYIIVALCGLVTIGAALLLMAVLDPANAAPDWLTGAVIAGVVIGLVLLIINVGVVATLISIHDRHCDLVDEAMRAGEELANIADALDKTGTLRARQ